MVEADLANSAEEPGADNDGHSGKLSYEHRVSDVLRDISKANLQEEILLNLRSPNGFTNGDLLISESSFIEGATCDKNKMQGYPAARKLLMLTFGEYSWTTSENGATDHIDRNLHLNLHSIIPKLPFLPDDLKDFFDESSLLDKIFKPRQWGSFLSVSNIMDFLFEPDPIEPPTADIKPFSRSMTLTSVKSVDPGIKVPRVLRERLYKGTSLAHAIERNFATVGGANTKRLQRRQSSFKFSRSTSSLIPVYVSLAIALILTVSGAYWYLKSSSLSGHSAAQKKTSAKDGLQHKLPKHVHK